MTASGEPTVVASAVSRWFGNLVAVSEVSFTLQPGITGLLGPNGAGKSTLLHMLSGLLRPSAGSLSVLGEEPWANPGTFRRVGMVHAHEAVYPFLTGREFVRLSARLHGLTDVGAATERAIGLVDLGNAADRKAGGYSKGMRQRIRIAAALVHDPEVLLLDEPFNGADPAQRVHLMDLLGELAKHGRTILVSSHILEEVERIASTVLVMVAGRLAATGDFRRIRQLMTDRPHSIELRTSDNRGLATELLRSGAVFGVDLAPEAMMVRTASLGDFGRQLPALARDRGVTLLEVKPMDESLESVFSYLVKR